LQAPNRVIGGSSENANLSVYPKFPPWWRGFMLATAMVFLLLKRFS
jgi:hypothetical protein